MKCGDCRFYSPNATPAHSPADGHGTCHVDSPGHHGGRGFPIVSARDWCGKFSGPEAGEIGRLTRLSEEYRRMATENLAAAGALTGKIGQLLARNWWQRLFNVIPWGKE